MSSARNELRKDNEDVYSPASGARRGVDMDSYAAGRHTISSRGGDTPRGGRPSRPPRSSGASANRNTRSAPAQSSSAPGRGLVGLLLILAVIATGFMLYYDDQTWLKISVAISLWAAALGFVLVGRYSGALQAEKQHTRTLRQLHRAQMELEESNHRERELALSNDYRIELEAQRDVARDIALEELREELAALRAQLAYLSGESLTEEQVALRARAERIRIKELEHRISDADQEQTAIYDRRSPLGTEETESSSRHSRSSVASSIPTVASESSDGSSSTSDSDTHSAQSVSSTSTHSATSGSSAAHAATAQSSASRSSVTRSPYSSRTGSSTEQVSADGGQEAGHKHSATSSSAASERASRSGSDSRDSREYSRDNSDSSRSQSRSTARRASHAERNTETDALTSDKTGRTTGRHGTHEASTESRPTSSGSHFATGSFAAVKWGGDSSSSDSEVPLIVDTSAFVVEPEKPTEAPAAHASSAQHRKEEKNDEDLSPRPTASRRRRYAKDKETTGRRHAGDFNEGLTVAELMNQLHKK